MIYANDLYLIIQLSFFIMGSFLYFLNFFNIFLDNYFFLKNKENELTENSIKNRKKIRYLFKYFNKVSKNHRVKVKLYIQDNQTDQATSLNLFFQNAVVFEKQLLEKLSLSGLKSVLLHELYHQKSRHSFRSIIYGYLILISTLLLFNELSEILFSLGSFNGKFSFLNQKEIILIFGSVIILSFHATFINPILFMINREWEKECDQFSVKVLGVKSFLNQAEYFNKNCGKLIWKNYIQEFMEKTHPSWDERINLAKKNIP